MMSRQDYVIIARGIRNALSESTDPNIRDGIVQAGARIADELKADNPNFDRVRFAIAASSARSYWDA